MEKYLSIYKPQGLTPLQLIEKLRSSNQKYQTVKIGFAGRLDPLAHGVMLLLLGEENKNRDQYLNLNKTYQFSVLFGVETDSYDYLGLLQSLEISPSPTKLSQKISQFIKNHTGIITQPYPPFSSKPLKGVPLYKLAKKGLLKNELLPSRQIEIFDFKLISIKNISSSKVKETILKNLKQIKGHFRQTKTIKKWQEFFSQNPNQEFPLVHFEINCSSGTYVRSLAHKMGQDFGCGAIAFEIYRPKVGNFIAEIIRI